MVSNLPSHEAHLHPINIALHELYSVIITSSSVLKGNYCLYMAQFLQKHAKPTDADVGGDRFAELAIEAPSGDYNGLNSNLDQ